MQAIWLVGGHPIRLVGRGWIHMRSTGRLEVYHNAKWGTVCDDGFGSNEATLMCRILGYSLGVVDSNAGSPGLGQIWLDQVRIFDILNTFYFHLYLSSFDT